MTLQLLMHMHPKLHMVQMFRCRAELGTIIYVAVEVRMSTLDQFVEIEFLTYSGSTSLRLSL